MNLYNTTRHQDDTPYQAAAFGGVAADCADIAEELDNKIEEQKSVLTKVKQALAQKRIEDAHEICVEALNANNKRRLEELSWLCEEDDDETN